MRHFSKLRAATLLFTLATLVYAYRTRQSHGTFLRVPFEFRFPTPQRVRERWWNAADDRILTPHVFGVGWSLNVHQVLKRLGYVGRDDGGDAGEGAAGQQ